MRRVVPAKTAAAVGRMARWKRQLRSIITRNFLTLRNIGLNAIGQTE
jgi:hypothetical protein